EARQEQRRREREHGEPGGGAGGLARCVRGRDGGPRRWWAPEGTAPPPGRGRGLWKQPPGWATLARGEGGGIAWMARVPPAAAAPPAAPAALPSARLAQQPAAQHEAHVRGLDRGPPLQAHRLPGLAPRGDRRRAARGLRAERHLPGARAPARARAVGRVGGGRAAARGGPRRRRTP